MTAGRPYAAAWPAWLWSLVIPQDAGRQAQGRDEPRGAAELLSHAAFHQHSIVQAKHARYVLALRARSCMKQGLVSLLAWCFLKQVGTVRIALPQGKIHNTHWQLSMCADLPQVAGDIKYNGHTFDEFVPERTSSFVNQVRREGAPLAISAVCILSRAKCCLIHKAQLGQYIDGVVRSSAACMSANAHFAKQEQLGLACGQACEHPNITAPWL